MDLHVIGPLASPAERAAVDTVLGPPESGWVGGARRPGADGHAARGGHALRSRRSELLPALHAVQDRVGWISQPALNYISRRLAVPPAEAYGVATFYALFATKPRAPTMAHVCDDIACRLAGAESICDDLTRTVGPGGGADRDGRVGWLRSPCLGLCEQAPAALMTVAGEHARVASAAPVDAAGVVGRLDGGGAPRRPVAIPQHGDPSLRLLRRVGVVDPASLDDYRAQGGYVALPKALEMGAESVIAEVTASKLMGRGGAAFPTGRKWAAVAGQPAQPHYVVCNADESEPGTFKDRVLMEGDPFAVVEAMTIAAVATGASQGYIYIRGEYPEAEFGHPRRDRRRAQGQPARCRHPRVGRLLRHRGPTWRRRLYLRRGDRPVRVDRGQTRRAAQQAAVPRRGGSLREADRREQRRDARERPAGPGDGERGVCRYRHRGLDRTPAVLPIRTRRTARGLRGRVRDDARRA